MFGIKADLVKFNFYYVITLILMLKIWHFKHILKICATILIEC